MQVLAWICSNTNQHFLEQWLKMEIDKVGVKQLNEPGGRATNKDGL